MSPSPDSASSDASHRQGSPVLTPYSDTTSSSSETDRVPNATEKPAKKRRKRATFTQREKMQLEMAFRHQPYLTGDDEKVLAQRLGLTAKNVRHWFKNHRARKLHKNMRSVYQTTLSNQFELVPEGRTIISRRLRFVPERTDSDHWKHTTCIS